MIERVLYLENWESNPISLRLLMGELRWIMTEKKKGEFLSIRDAIRGLLNTYHIESRFDEANLVASWEQIVGPAIAKRTKKVSIRNKVLFVEFNTAAMKNDFLLHKSKILELFHARF